TPLDLQRAEIELVLQSGLFAKAPRLEKFFQYICERHLDGEADQIKEYSIATEALGRDSEFDPKTDSIVRVEAHRLRKRLEAFYQGEGAGHAVHISIPNGQYRPQFSFPAELIEEPAGGPIDSAEPAEFSTVDVAALQATREENGSGASRGSRKRAILLALAGLSVVSAFFAIQYFRRRQIVVAPKQEVWVEPAGGFAMPAEFRMLAGYHGAPVLDRQGHSWLPDAFYRGGESLPIASEKLGKGQADVEFLRAQRSGRFEYAIPLRPTTYELHLYMVETEYGRGNPKDGGESTRLFQVSINGQIKLNDFDPLAEAGAPNRLYVRVFKDVRPGPDGKLHLLFQPELDNAFLNALEILPSPAGRIRPVRIVAQETPVTDFEGCLWAADKYFVGGHQVFRRNVLETGEDIFYRGERYGNFSYRIPLAQGKYRLKLYFAETWFGAAGSTGSAVDRRIFNVFVNGVALLRNYQVVKDAGGPNRGIEKVFEGMEPNAQGILLIDFVPVRNYAEVNAIEVVETG
ncbi:MAG TPA: malectin domain-containing carbohydrate-binding protein, partial [Bryobacteraceae bacterium]|nr:malectin domain-containing carbohydrate-binding protein [Bryobacteraceae bacterium]